MKLDIKELEEIIADIEIDKVLACLERESRNRGRRLTKINKQRTSMKVDIEELEEIIADIEIDKVLASHECESRKERRRLLKIYKQKKKEKICKYICYTSTCFWLSLALRENISNLFLNFPRELNEDNLFSNQKIISSDDEIFKIKDSLEKELNCYISTDEIDDYLVLNAIYDNKNLTDKEKDFFYKALPIIEDNPYINKEEAYHSLLNVDVKHMRRPKSYSDSIAGIYFGSYENIRIFEEDDDNRIISHEMIHCIFSNSLTMNLPRFFSEGMTELLANEYFSEDYYFENKSYPLEIVGVKMLCELVGDDRVLEAYSIGNIDSICHVLDCYGEIGDGEKLFQKLSSIYDSYDIYRDSGTNNLNLEEVMEVSNLFDNYCSSMELNDPGGFLYYKSLFDSFLAENPYDKYISSIYEVGVYAKPYFSSALKANVYGIVDSNFCTGPKHDYNKSLVLR